MVQNKIGKRAFVGVSIPSSEFRIPQSNMCLAVPAKIIELDGESAVVDLQGVKRSANVMMVPDAEIGDYVLLHAGFGIRKWTKEDVDEFNEITGNVVFEQ